jgi:hypothetical protein
MRVPALASAAARQVEAAVGLAALGFFAVVAGLVDPSQPGHYPTCPFRALTGLACPGCGSLRALHDLVHGHPVAALGHNGLFVVVLTGAVLHGFRVLLDPCGRWTTRVRPWAAPAAALVLLLWTVLRNLPVEPFRALAP